jgi:hypothetical protein
MVTGDQEGVASVAPSTPREETPEERRARWRSVGVHASALPTRGTALQGQWDRMSTWEKEHQAARELKAAGITPPNLKAAPAMVKDLNG